MRMRVSPPHFADVISDLRICTRCKGRNILSGPGKGSTSPTVNPSFA